MEDVEDATESTQKVKIHEATVPFEKADGHAKRSWSPLMKWANFDKMHSSEIMMLEAPKPCRDLSKRLWCPLRMPKHVLVRWINVKLSCQMPLFAFHLLNRKVPSNLVEVLDTYVD